ncbi:MAG: glycosyltransferase family 4 protein [Cyclobacteriaceae bacterium]
MNILVEAYDCEPDRGSEFGKSWIWLVNYLRAGHQVWCLTSVRGKKGIEKKFRQEDYPRLKIIYVYVNQYLDAKAQQGDSAILYLHYLLWLHSAANKAVELQKNIAFDFSHHISWESLQGGSELWKLNIPFIFGPVGGGQYPPRVLKPFFIKGWRTEMIRQFIGFLFMNLNPNTRKALSFAKKTLVLNQETEELAYRYHAKSVEYFLDINLSPDQLMAHYPQKKESDKLRLLWVGGLKFRKGLPLVLEALAHVPDYVDFELSIYGDGEAAKYLPGLIVKMRLSEKVRWYGNKPFSELRNAYLNHDAFIFCTLRETLGLQFFEAMSYGLPIITLDLHGAKKAIPDEAALKVKVSNQKEQIVRDLAEAVAFLYKNPELRQKMGRAAFDYVTELSETDYVKKILGYVKA